MGPWEQIPFVAGLNRMTNNDSGKRLRLRGSFRGVKGLFDRKILPLA